MITFLTHFFKYNQANELKRTSLYLLMSNFDRDLYDLILGEERVVSFINSIQIGRDLVYLADYTTYQWSGVRRLEVIKADQENLSKIIEACNEVMVHNVGIKSLRAEIRRRQSRRNVFEKTQYKGMVWLNYQVFSNELYHNVRYESQTELEITNQVLKFLPFLEPIQIISNVEAVINIFENFCRFNYIDELIDKKELNSFYLLTYYQQKKCYVILVQLILNTEVSIT